MLLCCKGRCPDTFKQIWTELIEQLFRTLTLEERLCLDIISRHLSDTGHFDGALWNRRSSFPILQVLIEFILSNNPSERRPARMHVWTHSATSLNSTLITNYTIERWKVTKYFYKGMFIVCYLILLLHCHASGKLCSFLIRHIHVSTIVTFSD